MSTDATHQASDKLGLWEPKRTLTLEAARRHSKRIKFLRFVLMIMAAILVGLLAWQFLNQDPPEIVEVNPTESVKMINPRYTGRTDDGLPYFLTASEAIRTTANDTVVQLANPVLEFYREAGVEQSTIAALSGTYDNVEKILNLNEQVELQTDDGNHCITSQARIFTKTKIVEGDQPISCDGNFGTANGNTFEILEDYKVFVFKDGMEAVLEQAGNTGQSDGLSENLSFGGDSDIFIKAERALYKGRLTLLEESVEVKQDDAIILADKIDIHRSPKDETQSQTVNVGAVARIDAKGNFSYRTPTNFVTGDKGVYLRRTRIITVTGDVKVVQDGGSNTATTEKLIYNTNTDTIQLAGGRCFGESCKDRSTVRIGNGK